MRLWESTYTVAPFVYLILSSGIFGLIFHAKDLVLYQPYIVLVFILINTIVYYAYDTKKLVKHRIHKHVWQTVTLSMYGILLTNVHTELFRDFHYASETTNITVSIIYILSIVFAGYYVDSDAACAIINIVFAFFPLRRVWRINMFMYVIFTVLAILIMFRRVKMSELQSDTYNVKPVLRFFMYLRVHDICVPFGILQIYFDYYKSVLPEIKASQDITKILEETHKDLQEQENEFGIV